MDMLTGRSFIFKGRPTRTMTGMHGWRLEHTVLLLISILCSSTFSAQGLILLNQGRSRRLQRSVTEELVRDTRPVVPQTRWTDYGPWGPCSRTCGSGIQARTRTCFHKFSNEYLPDSDCVGDSQQISLCKVQECPAGIASDYREEECSQLSMPPMVWKPLYLPKDPSINPCWLSCYSNQVAYWKIVAQEVPDGTPCVMRSASGVCINNECKTYGCDGLVGSTKVKDICGVCDGDRTSCNVVTSTKIINHLQVGYNEALEVPAGAINIRILEVLGGKNYLALRERDGPYVINGNYRIDNSRLFSASGSLCSYRRTVSSTDKTGMSHTEMITCTGPVNDSITIMVLTRDRSPSYLAYEYALPLAEEPSTASPDTLQTTWTPFLYDEITDTEYQNGVKEGDNFHLNHPESRPITPTASYSWTTELGEIEDRDDVFSKSDSIALNDKIDVVGMSEVGGKHGLGEEGGISSPYTAGPSPLPLNVGATDVRSTSSSGEPLSSTIVPKGSLLHIADEVRNDLTAGPPSSEPPRFGKSDATISKDEGSRDSLDNHENENNTIKDAYNYSEGTLPISEDLESITTPPLRGGTFAKGTVPSRHSLSDLDDVVPITEKMKAMEDGNDESENFGDRDDSFLYYGGSELSYILEIGTVTEADQLIHKDDFISVSQDTHSTPPVRESSYGRTGSTAFPSEAIVDLGPFSRSESSGPSSRSEIVPGKTNPPHEEDIRGNHDIKTERGSYTPTQSPTVLVPTIVADMGPLVPDIGQSSSHAISFDDWYYYDYSAEISGLSDLDVDYEGSVNREHGISQMVHLTPPVTEHPKTLTTAPGNVWTSVEEGNNEKQMEAEPQSGDRHKEEPVDQPVTLGLDFAEFVDRRLSNLTISNQISSKTGNVSNGRLNSHQLGQNRIHNSVPGPWQGPENHLGGNELPRPQEPGQPSTWQPLPDQPTTQQPITSQETTSALQSTRSESLDQVVSQSSEGTKRLTTGMAATVGNRAVEEGVTGVDNLNKTRPVVGSNTTTVKTGRQESLSSAMIDQDVTTVGPVTSSKLSDIRNASDVRTTASQRMSTKSGRITEGDRRKAFSISFPDASTSSPNESTTASHDPVTSLHGSNETSLHHRTTLATPHLALTILGSHASENSAVQSTPIAVTATDPKTSKVAADDDTKQVATTELIISTSTIAPKTFTASTTLVATTTPVAATIPGVKTRPVAVSTPIATTAPITSTTPVKTTPIATTPNAKTTIAKTTTVATTPVATTTTIATTTPVTTANAVATTTPVAATTSAAIMTPSTAKAQVTSMLPSTEGNEIGEVTERPEFIWRRTAASCQVTCGRGLHHEYVYCVNRYGIEVADHFCNGQTKPNPIPTSCTGQRCEPRWVVGAWSSCPVTCGGGLQYRTVSCWRMEAKGMDAMIHPKGCIISSGHELPEIQECSTQPCLARWQSGDWSSCSAQCGEGERRRTVLCSVPEGARNHCDPATRPADTQACQGTRCHSNWGMSPWPQCTGHCQTQMRRVDCISVSGAIDTDDNCYRQRKPLSSRLCGSGDCGPQWIAQAWNSDNCGNCQTGYQSREVTCQVVQAGHMDVVSDDQCSHLPVPTRRSVCSGCVRQASVQWHTSRWMSHNCRDCRTGYRSREVSCRIVQDGGHMVAVSEDRCSHLPVPERRASCGICNKRSSPLWYTTRWSSCSVSCGGGHKRRRVRCYESTNVPSNMCDNNAKPPTIASCNNTPCAAAKPSCVDRLTKSQCTTVKRSKLCRHNYYRQNCCATCRG